MPEERQMNPSFCTQVEEIDGIQTTTAMNSDSDSSCHGNPTLNQPPLPTRWNFVSDFNCGDPEWYYIGCCHSLGSTLVCWENWQLGTWENRKTPEVLWCSSTIKKHTRTHRTKHEAHLVG